MRDCHIFAYNLKQAATTVTIHKYSHVAGVQNFGENWGYQSTADHWMGESLRCIARRRSFGDRRTTGRYQSLAQTADEWNWVFQQN